ncbi:MAG: VWA domain-containing protein, partial [Devosia sp.]
MAGRLKSVVSIFNGPWIMDTRRLIPAGTAVLALLILAPLGYQLYSTTALTPTAPKVIGVPPVEHPTAPKDADAGPATPATPPAQAAPKPAANGGPVESVLTKSEAATSGTTPPPEPQAGTVPPTASTGMSAAGQAAVPAKPGAPAEEERTMDAVASTSAPLADENAASNAPVRAAEATAAPMPAPVAMPAPASRDAVAAPMVSSGAAQQKMVAGAISPRTATQATGDKFQNFAESPVKAVATDPVSTFSIDVDTASYSYVRRALNEGRIPAPDAVRLEELINYFPYDYPAATDPNAPFKPTIAVFPTPWNSKTELMAIGIKGYD